MEWSTAHADRLLIATALLGLLVCLCSYGDSEAPAVNRKQSCLMGSKIACLQLKLEASERENNRLRGELTRSRSVNMELRAHVAGIWLGGTGLVVGAVLLTIAFVDLLYERQRLKGLNERLVYLTAEYDKSTAEHAKTLAALRTERNREPPPDIVAQRNELSEQNWKLCTTIREERVLVSALREELADVKENCEASSSAREENSTLKEEIVDMSTKLMVLEDEKWDMEALCGSLTAELDEVKSAWASDRDELVKLKKAAKIKASGSSGQGSNKAGCSSEKGSNEAGCSNGQGSSNVAKTSTGGRKGKRALDED